MTSGTLYRLTAFTTDPAGGNPAGVWIGHALPQPSEMQRIAAEVGFSETAFISPSHGTKRTVRYYSPEAEVSFCGHATIAAGVALGESAGDGIFYLSTIGWRSASQRALERWAARGIAYFSRAELGSHTRSPIR
jgi:PhzF family phenazine biosynthesis protein